MIYATAGIEAFAEACERALAEHDAQHQTTPPRFPIFMTELPKRITMFGDVIEPAEPREAPKVKSRAVHLFKDPGPALE